LEYTMRMGVDTRLVSAASTIPPWQEIRWLTQDEMIAWKVDNTHRVYTDIVFHAFGRSGSYIETSSEKGSDESYLRFFCKNTIREPLFTFIIDQTLPTGRSAATPNGINTITDHVRSVLSRMNIVLSRGANDWTAAFRVMEIQSAPISDNKVRVYAVVQPD